MDERSAPLALPAAGLLLGTCLAGSLESVSPVRLVLLALLGLALRRRPGIFVAALALGLLNAGARWTGPERELATLELSRPLELSGRVVSHPVPDGDGGVLFRVEARQLVQGGRPLRAARDVWVVVPGEDKRPDLGSTVRLRGYLRRSPGYGNSPSPRPGPWRMRLKSNRFLHVESSPSPWMRLGNRLRHRTEAAFEGAASAKPESGGLALARALLLGERRDLPLAWRQTLRRLGLVHLLAVSGLHVAILAFLALAAASPLPRGPRYVAALLAVALYLMLIGPRPAVLRAAVMGLVALAALLAERPPQAVNALALCVAALVLEDPAIVADLGFQLSAAATAGIVVLAPVYQQRWTLLPMALRAPLAATLAAQLATWPLLVPLTGVVHPAAALYNLAAIPWLGLFLAAAFPWLLVAGVSPVLAADLVSVLDVLAWPLEALASLPPAPADLRPLTLSAGALTCLAAVLGAAGCRPRRAATAALLVLLLALQGAPGEPPAPRLVVFDVGQGDAVLLADGPRAVLVDGGGWRHGDLGGRVLLPALARAGVSRLEAVMMTHADVDHCGGLADLVHYLPVREVWTARPDPEQGCAERLLAAPGPRPRVLRPGDRLEVGRWRLHVLHPEAGDRGKSNDLSLVVAAELPGFLESPRVLLTGDLEAAGERLLLRRYGPEVLSADVLKVAHHGSKSSTTASWLKAVDPRIALVSVGRDNTYGHPHPAVLARLARRGSRVLRTDLSGRIDLTFHPNGRIVFALPYAPAP